MKEGHGDRKRAHGLTFQQNKDLRVKQVQREVKMIPANNAQNFQDEHFEKEYQGYEIPEHDAIHYHVAIEARTFDPTSGEKLSRSRVQIYPVKTFEAMVRQKPYSGFHGFKTHILHDPTRKEEKHAHQINEGGDEPNDANPLGKEQPGLNQPKKKRASKKKAEGI